MKFDIDSAFDHVDKAIFAKAKATQEKAELDTRIYNLYLRSLSILDGITPTEPTQERYDPYDAYARRVTDSVVHEDRRIRLREEVQLSERQPNPQTIAVYVEQVSPVKSRLFRIAKESAQMDGVTMNPKKGGLDDIGAAEAMVTYIDKKLLEDPTS